jgi:hypothetical protein
MYGDVSLAFGRREEKQGLDTGARQVTPDLTCPVTVFTLRIVSGNDLTPRGTTSGQQRGASSRSLTEVLTVTLPLRSNERNSKRGHLDASLRVSGHLDWRVRSLHSEPNAESNGSILFRMSINSV